MKKIVILISGRGSNMEAIIATCRAERWPAEVACVISSKPNAPGLQVAQRAGIETVVVDARGGGSRDRASGDGAPRDAASSNPDSRARFEAALVDAIDHHRADCIVLAGFMRVLSEAFVHRYADRMLNVHPSLLPAFAGLDTHTRALAAGVRVHGATVHFVSPVVDAGAIVAQAVVAVRPDDSPDSLAARVLEAEHRLFPRAVGWFVRGQMTLAGDRVALDAAAANEALMVCV